MKAYTPFKEDGAVVTRDKSAPHPVDCPCNTSTSCVERMFDWKADYFMPSPEPPSHAAYFALRDRLLGDLRTTELTGDQLLHAGQVIYGHPDGLSLYGVPASRMEQTGIRLLGRTVIECCIDAYAIAVAEALGQVHTATPADDASPLVVDLFCGSGNFSHHFGRLARLAVHASEIDPQVHALARHNLDRTGASTELHLADYRELLRRLPARGPRDTYFIEPPWGPAFTPAGLDLLQTSPPVPEIIDDIRRSRNGRPCIIAIKTNDQIAYDSLNASFADAEHLRSITPLPTLPHGANMQFHLYRLRP